MCHASGASRGQRLSFGEAPQDGRSDLRPPWPINIFHGEVDGTTRVEGVRETEAAFRAAGRTNLTVHIYPGHGHDLDWTPSRSVRVNRITAGQWVRG